MHISTDRPTIPWNIAASTPNNDAAAVTSISYLSDGKVSVPFRFTWDTGSQTTSDFVHLGGSITGFSLSADQLTVLAVLMPKTPYAIPAGVLITASFTGFVWMTPYSVSFSSRTVELDDGSVAFIALASSPNDFSPGVAAVHVFNDQNSATWATPGQSVDIGEIWFGTLQEFKNTTDPQRTLVDNVTNRRSHNNTNQPLYGPKPYYSWKYNFAPMPNASAYSSATIPTYSQVEYQMSQSRSMLILGRIYTPGTTTINTDDLKFFAAFGRPATNGLQQMQAVRDGPYWVAGLVFETQPP